jgi:GDPmannose 4,6-dehydratase
MKNGRVIKSTGPAWVVQINKRPMNKLYRPHVSEVRYSGKVWCLEVEKNENFLVTRGGKVFFSGNSTSEMFGSSPPPQNELTRLQPRSPYGNAKAFAHWSCINAREAYGLHVSCGILFNHESQRRGEEFVTRKVAKGAARIKLGLQSQLVLGNLDAKRDWGHARDYVEAMYLMLQQPSPDDYVIATGQTRSIREFLDAAFGCLGIDWKNYVIVDPALYRPAEVHALCGDASKARRVLGWRPTVSFEDMVKEMVDAEIVRAKALSER